MDTMTYASVAVLPWSIAKNAIHPAGFRAPSAGSVDDKR
jgi:hypothetical protein